MSIAWEKIFGDRLHLVGLVRIDVILPVHFICAAPVDPFESIGEVDQLAVVEPGVVAADILQVQWIDIGSIKIGGEHVGEMGAAILLPPAPSMEECEACPRRVEEQVIEPAGRLPHILPGIRPHHLVEGNHKFRLVPLYVEDEDSIIFRMCVVDGRILQAIISISGAFSSKPGKIDAQCVPSVAGQAVYRTAERARPSIPYIQDSGDLFSVLDIVVYDLVVREPLKH